MKRGIICMALLHVAAYAMKIENNSFIAIEKLVDEKFAITVTAASYLPILVYKIIIQKSSENSATISYIIYEKNNPLVTKNGEEILFFSDYETIAKALFEISENHLIIATIMKSNIEKNKKNGDTKFDALYSVYKIVCKYAPNDKNIFSVESYLDYLLEPLPENERQLILKFRKETQMQIPTTAKEVSIIGLWHWFKQGYTSVRQGLSTFASKFTGPTRHYYWGTMGLGATGLSLTYYLYKNPYKFQHILHMLKQQKR